MDTRSLHVYRVVCSTLNFSRAAEQLHMSVSAVSRTVLRLEEAIGQRLLARDKRSMRLTPAGQTFLTYAEATLADWQRIQSDLASDSQIVGAVNLFCSVTASYSILSPVLTRFRDAFPAVDIMLHTGDQADGLQRVLDKRDDLAVTGRPQSLPQRLAFLQLTESPMRMCIPRTDCAVRRLFYGGAGRAPVVDWSLVPFIVPERGVSKAIIDDWFRRQGIVRPLIYAQVAGHEAIVAMVALGLGVGVAPEIVIRSGGFVGDVELLDLGEALPVLEIGLCSMRSKLPNPVVQSLLDVARDTYPDAI